MPVMLAHETIDAWLKPDELSQDMLKFFMKLYDPDKMQAWPVSTAVNNARNQGKELIRPITSISKS